MQLVNLEHLPPANFPPYLSPDETGVILRDFIWREFELGRMCAGWTPSFVGFEDKVRAGNFAYWHTRNMRVLEQRIRELPGAFRDQETVPAPLREAYTRISLAPTERAFWTGYALLMAKLYADYDALLAALDPVTNSPTVDAINYVLVNRNTITQWLVANPLDRHPAIPQENSSGLDTEWLNYAESVYMALGEVTNGNPNAWPDVPEAEPIGPIPEKGHSDPRMIISDSLVTPPKAEERVDFYMDHKNSPIVDNVRQMIFINATEVSAAERVAYIYYSMLGMPLEFYYDTARHMWDEFRHSEMGVRRLLQLGFKLEQFRFWGSQAVAKSTTAREHYEFYSELTNSAETCSFGYKRACAEAFRKHGDIISAVQSEFDVADERLHTGFGTRWSPELFKEATGESMTAGALVDRYRTARLKSQGMTDEEIATAKRSINAFCGSTGSLGHHMDAVARAKY